MAIPKLSLKPWSMENKHNSSSKTKNTLSKASNGLGLGPWGSWDMGSWEHSSSLLRGCGYQSQDTVFDLWCAWNIVCSLCATLLDQLPNYFVPLCNSFLLTLSHFPPANSIEDVILLNKLSSMSHQLVQASWSQLLSFLFSHLWFSLSTPHHSGHFLIVFRVAFMLHKR